MTGESQSHNSILSKHYFEKWQLSWKHLDNHASPIKAMFRITISVFLFKENCQGEPLSSKMNRLVKMEHNSLCERAPPCTGSWERKQKTLPLWWFALDTTFPHKVTINIIISSFPFVAFCKYLLLILQIKIIKILSMWNDCFSIIIVLHLKLFMTP